MKVIQVIPSLNLAGAERICEALTLELKRKGNAVKIISFYSLSTPITNALIQVGVEILFLNKKPGFDISVIKKLIDILKKERPDVVHSHLDAVKYVMIAVKKTNIPIHVHTVHNVAEKELDFIGRILVRRFYKSHQIIPVALSKLIQESIVKTYKILPENVPIVINGIDLSNCLPKHDYRFGNTIKILHIGRFSEQKNHKGLIDAFKIFHTTKSNSVLELIGEGHLMDEIRKYVYANHLDDAVIFLGAKSNVFQDINEADIFVYPSLYEGIPVTLIEAMGTGIPIIATNVGGISDILINDENALLTDVDSQEIAMKMIMLAECIQLRERLGQNAYNCSRKFSSEEMTKQYIKIYQKMMQER